MTPEERVELERLTRVMSARITQEELAAEERATTPRGNGASTDDDDDVRVVPSPANPMGVAREVVDALYMSSGVSTLRYHCGDFYRWNGTCWPEIDQRDVRAAAYTLLEKGLYYDSEGKTKPFQPSRRKIDDVIDALRALVLIDSQLRPPMWMNDTDGHSGHRDQAMYCHGGRLAAGEIIAMSNGLLHFPSRTLLEHTPHFFTHHSLPFAFEADAPTPARWERFLHELWGDDESSVSALQELMGYVLGGGTSQQKIFLLVGPKRGGKGTIGRVVTGLLGAHNVAAPTLSGMATNFGLSPLIGKPLALISDARLGKADNKVVVERLLSVSGEDSLTIDRKYRDPWTGRLPTRFLVLTNELPRLADSSGALASRFVLLVLRKSFYGVENPKLTDELLTEAPSILNWALQGLDRLNQRGFFVNPESGKEAIQQLEDLSSPVSAFIRERCCLEADEQVDVDALWKSWRTWCDEDNRHRHQSRFR